MPSSWTRSREAALWQRLSPSAAGRVLARTHGEACAAEALLRAFLAERDGSSVGARFWLEVYAQLSRRAGTFAPFTRI